MLYLEPWCMPQLFASGIIVFYKDYYTKKAVTIIKGTVVVGFTSNSDREVKEVTLKDGSIDVKACEALFGDSNIPAFVLAFVCTHINELGVALNALIVNALVDICMKCRDMCCKVNF
ncbi:hypothetical protein Fmac_020498 [Flemingia macrophylla]|uniref:Uncharacterized protein n=1 Tax=Flemingia macrophylla TaxID=520843 RepID=A0ABD1LU66_9FABA